MPPVLHGIKSVSGFLHPHKTVNDFYAGALGNGQLVIAVNVSDSSLSRGADDDCHTWQRNPFVVFYRPAQFYHLHLPLWGGRTESDVDDIAFKRRLAGSVTENLFQQLFHALVFHGDIQGTDGLDVFFIVHEA